MPNLLHRLQWGATAATWSRLHPKGTIMNKTSRRILAVGLPLCLVAVTGVSVAFWTSSGSGTGTASTQSGVASLTVAQASAPTNLAPGVAAGAVSATVTNPAGSTSNVQVSQVVVTYTVAPLTGQSCTTADYTLTGGTMTAGAADLKPGASTTFTGATLGFNSTAANQDGCKGATVNLSYAAS